MSLGGMPITVLAILCFWCCYPVDGQGSYDLALVANLNPPGIFVAPTDTFNFTAIPGFEDRLRRPVAIDYDPVDAMVYWTDVEHGTISRSLLDGNNHVVLIKGLQTPDGLTLKNRMMYWTDAGSDLIERATLDGLSRMVVLNLTDASQYGVEPRAIVVDPEKELLFWTDWGSSPKIERATTDGQDRMVLVDTDLQWPNGLALDLNDKRLFWCDAGLNTIESIDYKGGSRVLYANVSSHDIHPFDIWYYQHYLYWTDWISRALYRLELGLERKIEVIGSESFRQAAGLHIYKVFAVSPCLGEPCMNGGTCSVSGSQDSYSCLCVDGFSGTNCENKPGPYNLAFVANLDPPGIYVAEADTFNFTLIPGSSGYTSRPIAIDYDPVDGRVYWTDVALSSIYRSFVDGSSVEVLISNVNVPDGLALDLETRVMYWTAGGSDLIEKSTLDGLDRTVVLNLTDSSRDQVEPRAIILDTHNRYLFWTDWGTVPRIERANTDGSARMVLVNTNLGWPNGLALDAQGDRLYWCDAQTNKIESSDLLGNDRRHYLDLTQYDIHPFDIVLYDGFAYWTDWKFSLIRSNLHGGIHVEQYGTEIFKKAGGLHIFEDKFTDHSCTDLKPCHESIERCRQFNTSFKCVCKDGSAGAQCTRDNPCSGKPCREGKCFQKSAITGAPDYFCRCPPLVTGKNCETHVTPCLSNPCANGGTCVASSLHDTYVCYCLSDFFGTNCATQVESHDVLTCYETCSTSTFTSINYPQHYPNSYKAVYLIYVPGASGFAFRFDKQFEIEKGKDVLYIGAGLDVDFTAILEDNVNNGGNVFFFEGNEAPKPFVVTGTEKIWMYFETNKEIQQKGFRVRWNVIASNYDLALVANLSPPGIFVAPTDTFNFTAIPGFEDRLRRPVAIDYDPVDAMVYWTDVEHGIISRSFLDGSGHVVLVTGLQIPDGLALDPEKRVMYWTNGGSDSIEKATLDGLDRTVVLDLTDASVGSVEPRAIVVDPGHRLMFWTDWGSSPKIERAYTDGTSRLVLVSTNLQFPNGLALDLDGGRLFWCDAGLNTIESIDFAGGNRVKYANVTSHDIHPFDIWYYRNHLFWTDWISKSLFRLEFLKQIKIEGFGSTSFDKGAGLHIYKDEFKDHSCTDLMPCDESTERCRQFDTTYQCLCKDSTAGANCTLENVCSPSSGNPCHEGECFQKSASIGGVPEYFCQCPPLFTGTHCETAAPSALVFVANLQPPGIYVALGETFNFTLIKGSEIYTSRPVAINYDPVDEKVYWTDVALFSIRRCSLDGSDMEVLVSNVNISDGLTLDLENRMMYWTVSGSDLIEKATLDGHDRTVVLNLANSSRDQVEPRAIILDTDNRYLFWTDWGSEPRIERASVDGFDRTVLINTNLAMPNGLALDSQGNYKRLYWCDARTDRIESSDLNGINRRVFLDLTQYDFHPFGIALYNGFVYWTDWKYSMLRANLPGTGIHVEQYGTETFQKACGLHIYEGR